MDTRQADRQETMTTLSIYQLPFSVSFKDFFKDQLVLLFHVKNFELGEVGEVGDAANGVPSTVELREVDKEVNAKEVAEAAGADGENFEGGNFFAKNPAEKLSVFNVENDTRVVFTNEHR